MVRVHTEIEVALRGLQEIGRAGRVLQRRAIVWYLLSSVSLVLVAACGGDVRQGSVAVDTPVAQVGEAVAKSPTPTPLPSATPEPPATNTPQPTNTRVLPFTPIATADPNQPVRADIARISVVEAKAQVEAGRAILVDVRSKGSYDQVRISGAVSMPGSEVARRYGELPHDKLVIFYCA